MKKKIIIFDLDGVLFDSSGHVSKFFLDTYPTLTKVTMDEMLTGNFHRELEKFKSANVPIVETEEERKKRNTEYSDKKSKLPLYAGIKELLIQLHAERFILAVNTSALERNCVPLLKQADILTLFDFIATKEVAIDKTEKFRLISEKYQTSPEEMIFITDTLGDIREADEAHVPTIAVTWGAHDRSFFERESHSNLIKIVDSVDELQEYLLK